METDGQTIKCIDDNNRNTLKPTSINFVVITYFLRKYIKEKGHILDVAAGSGRYAEYYYQKGYRLTALDTDFNNVEALRKKVEDSDGFSVEINGAKTLSEFKDDIFDVVFNVGPAYQLNHDELRRSISESLRILKSGGVFVMTYMNKYQRCENELVNESFNYQSFGEIEQLMSEFSPLMLQHSPVDGILYKKLTDLITLKTMDLDDCYMWLDNNSPDFVPVMHYNSYNCGLVIASKID